MLVTISYLPPTSERPQSINIYCRGSVRYTAMNCILLFLSRVPHSHSLQSVFVYNFTNMHAMSYRYDFFAGSCRVNIYKPAVCYTVTLLAAVFRVELPRFLNLTAMSYWKSLNTSLLKVMISSKNEQAFFRDFSDITLQIIFDAWWVSLNVYTKLSIAWNNSRHAPSWQI